MRIVITLPCNNFNDRHWSYGMAEWLPRTLLHGCNYLSMSAPKLTSVKNEPLELCTFHSNWLVDFYLVLIFINSLYMMTIYFDVRSMSGVFINRFLALNALSTHNLLREKCQLSINWWSSGVNKGIQKLVFTCKCSYCVIDELDMHVFDTYIMFVYDNEMWPGLVNVVPCTSRISSGRGPHAITSRNCVWFKFHH